MSFYHMVHLKNKDLRLKVFKESIIRERNKAKCDISLNIVKKNKQNTGKNGEKSLTSISSLMKNSQTYHNISMDISLKHLKHQVNHLGHRSKSVNVVLHRLETDSTLSNKIFV